MTCACGHEKWHHAAHTERCTWNGCLCRWFDDESPRACETCELEHRPGELVECVRALGARVRALEAGT